LHVVASVANTVRWQAEAREEEVEAPEVSAEKQELDAID
jgi:hypothetical protein